MGLGDLVCVIQGFHSGRCPVDLFHSTHGRQIGPIAILTHRFHGVQDLSAVSDCLNLPRSWLTRTTRGGVTFGYKAPHACIEPCLECRVPCDTRHGTNEIPHGALEPVGIARRPTETHVRCRIPQESRKPVLWRPRSRTHLQRVKPGSMWKHALQAMSGLRIPLSKSADTFCPCIST